MFKIDDKNWNFMFLCFYIIHYVMNNMKSSTIMKLIIEFNKKIHMTIH